MDELERLQAWLPFRYQVLKGQANYVSVSAFDVLRQAPDEMPLETRLGLVYLLRWLQTTREVPWTNCTTGLNAPILASPTCVRR